MLRSGLHTSINGGAYCRSHINGFGLLDEMNKVTIVILKVVHTYRLKYSFLMLAQGISKFTVDMRCV